MAKQYELVSPAILAEMKAELESLSSTEPGAREISEVVAELMPLIRGCRDRGHSWKRIAESLKKFHSGLSVGRLKKYAYELDPSLKSDAKKSQTSLIPEMDVESEVSDDDEEESNWPPLMDDDESTKSSKKSVSKEKALAVDF
ncbi:MAG: hypothetical protein HC810_08775 [Acaryochloridaceae cyanobacterium RL_2_7]|nr:hypothetical protein [Acaryochloridaceae cyanobacterium RL_2_7]